MNIIIKVKCNRCQSEWYPRTTDEPKRCPRCGSPYWNKPRIRLQKIKE